MRVAIDARHLGQGRGIARYVEQMLDALVDLFPDDEWVAVVPGRRPVTVPAAVELRRTVLPSRLVYAAAALCGRPRLDQIAGGCDVCWIPAPAPIALAAATPYVLTLLDRSFEANPKDFTPYERLWHRLARPRKLAAHATTVVAISETSLDDLLAAGWPIDREHAIVIGAAPSASVTPSEGDSSAGARAHLLYVGALEPRKGIAILSSAFQQARDAGLDAHLVVVGEGRDAGLLAGVTGVTMLGRQSDEQLTRLYAESIALVVPSISEGFGLPAVEAAAHGVPALTSDLPIFRETLGSGHLSFALSDAGALAAAMIEICGDQALRDSLGGAAAAAVATRTWPAAAERLHSVLRQAAG